MKPNANSSVRLVLWVFSIWSGEWLKVIDWRSWSWNHLSLLQRLSWQVDRLIGLWPRLECDSPIYPLLLSRTIAVGWIESQSISLPTMQLYHWQFGKRFDCVVMPTVANWTISVKSRWVTGCRGLISSWTPHPRWYFILQTVVILHILITMVIVIMCSLEPGNSFVCKN